MKFDIKALDVRLDEKSKKLYVNDAEVGSAVRKLEDMKDVIFNQNIINKRTKDDILYYMYRGLGMERNPTIFEAHNIRHDITVMADYDLGGEFNKTFGHYHPICSGGLAYAEVYEVIFGEALYLMQKRYDGGNCDVVIMHAKQGDKVIMPSNYGHISINIGGTLLVEANLVNSTFESDYKPIQQARGGAIYVTTKKEMVVNQHYKDVSLSYREAPKISFLDPNISLYDEYLAHPEHFKFLNRPELLFWKEDSWYSSSEPF